MKRSLIAATLVTFAAYGQQQTPREPTADELKTALTVTESQRNAAQSQYASMLASAESQLKAANAQIEQLKKEAAECKPAPKVEEKK